jgi:hypothetical protein
MLLSDSLPDLPPARLQLEQGLVAELLLIYAGMQMGGIGLGLGQAVAQEENGGRE